MPQKNFKQPTLIYDGACPLCTGIVRGLRQLGLKESARFISWQEATKETPTLAQSELAEKIRGEVLLLLPDSKVLSGVPAFARLLEQKKPTRRLGHFLKMPGIAGAAEWLYQTVAFNRRVLTPPSNPAIACACDPPENPSMRRRLYVLLLLVAVSGLIAFSCALAATFQTRAFTIILHLLIAMGGGWLLAYFGLFLLLRKHFGEYVRQSLVVMSIGGLWLWVASALLTSVHFVFHADFPFSSAWISVLVLNLHTAIMLFSTLRRSRALHFPAWTPWLWLLLYFSGYLFLLNRFP